MNAYIKKETLVRDIVFLAILLFTVFLLTGFVSGSWVCGIVFTASSVALTYVGGTRLSPHTLKIAQIVIVLALGVVMSIIRGGYGLYYIVTTVGAAIGAIVFLRCALNGKYTFGAWTTHWIAPIAAILFVELLNGWNGDLPGFGFTYNWFNNVEVGMSHLFHIAGAVFVWLIFVFIRRIAGDKVGTIIASVPMFLLGITNFLVYAITKQPFIPSDLQIAGTAFSVIGEQQFTIGAILTVVASVLLFVGYIVFIIKYADSTGLSSGKQGVKSLITALSAAFAAFVLFEMIATTTDSVLLYDGNHKFGFVSNFIINLDYKLKFDSDVTDYLPEPDTDTDGAKPNVIIVMDEAFSDLQSEFDLELNYNTTENFMALCEKYPHGIAYSSVRGNNTCSSEWEVLSGVPTALTRKGAIVFQNNAIPMQTIVSAFNARGYSTYGIHPYFRNGYNRGTLYDALGFVHTTFIEDINTTECRFVREFISDETDFQMIIDAYEQRDQNKPFFCFNVTMQNHAGYEEDGGLEEKVVLNMECAEKAGTENYLTLINETDNALPALINYFENVSEPTVILFFGDHQPLINFNFYEKLLGKKESEYTLADLQRVYEVPYLIWANYELDASKAPYRTSLCYLSKVLFEVAGIELTPFMRQQEAYQQAYPIITTNFVEDSEGNLYAPSDIAKYDALLSEYRKYSQGILYGIDH